MISVCLASYNGEKYIREQIESILCQIEDGDELIISDDGSTDETIKIINQIDDMRIHLLLNNSHNYTKNFENALTHANGDFIFLSDQDDIWTKDKVEKTLNLFKKTGCDFIVSDATVVDSDKHVLIPSYFQSCNIRKGFVHNLIATRYIGACMAFRKNVLERVLPIPGSTKYIAHDYWIACIAERYYNVQLLDSPLILYRRHADNVSPGVSNKSQLSILERVYKRAYVLRFIIQRAHINTR